MKKHIILALNPALNSALEKDRRHNFIAEHTLNSLQELKYFGKNNQYFKPDGMVISADLKDNPELIDNLLNLKSAPKTKDTTVILFTNEINDSDIEMVKKIGKLLSAGIYPVLQEPTLKSVKLFLNTEPDMTDQLTNIYKHYKQLLKKQQETAHTEIKSDEDEETKSEFTGPAKMIVFNEAKSGDGKNFILSNYAMTLSNFLTETKSAKKIAIIDFDNRNSDLSSVFNSVENDGSPMQTALKAVKRYTTQNRLKSNADEGTQRKLVKQFQNSVLSAFSPVGGNSNLFILSHNDEDLQKISDLNSSDMQSFLPLLQHHFDILIFNVNSNLFAENAFMQLFKTADIIYSIITMNRKDINLNLNLNQIYIKNGVNDKVRYLLNKYPDEDYNEQLGQPMTTKLLFDKNIINNYNLNVTNVIPFIYPSILYNESFSGVLLANETEKTTEYPRESFKMIVADSGYPIEI